MREKGEKGMICRICGGECEIGRLCGRPTWRCVECGEEIFATEPDDMDAWLYEREALCCEPAGSAGRLVEWG